MCSEGRIPHVKLVGEAWKVVRHRVTLALFLLTLSLLPQAALAWNAAGHRLSALIAWQQLDRNTRQRVTHILVRHPDYERWIARAKGGDFGAAAFLEASTWPDDIKNDQRFYDVDENVATPPLPGFPDKLRHRDWHYINRPLAHSPKGLHSSGQLDTQIEILSKLIGDRKHSNEQRAYALPWLIHLIADAHQPLHVVSRYDANGRGDEGGNRFFIEQPLYPRRSSMSLHAYWDDLPAPPWLRGERLEQLAASIVTAHPPPAPKGDTGLWLQESWAIASDKAYPAGDDPVPTLTAAFHSQAYALAQQRIAEAGYRLAARLQELLREDVD